MSADDTRPHSRACGVRKHDHGLFCHSNCPTCGWRPATAAHTAATSERETLAEVLRVAYLGMPRADAHLTAADALLDHLAAAQRPDDREATLRAAVERLHYRQELPFVTCAEDDCDHIDGDCPTSLLTVCGGCYEWAGEVHPYFTDRPVPDFIMWPCPVGAALAAADGEATK